MFVSYTYSSNHQYPLSVDPIDQTYNVLVGKVNTTIISARPDLNNLDAVGFLSTMTMSNISTLQRAGVFKVSCGSFTTQSQIFIELNGSLISLK